MEMSEEILVSNYAKYKKSLDRYVGEELADNLIECLGGQEKVMRATFDRSTDTGLAYDGSFVKATLTFATYCVKVNALLS